MYPQTSMFSYDRLEERVPRKRPIRHMHALVGDILASLNHQFDACCLHTNRPSIPPEYLLCALLLQILFSIRSEHQTIEPLDCNLLIY